MNWILIVFGVLAAIGFLGRRRRLFLLRKENEIRAKLDLPPLTDAEFGIDPGKVGRISRQDQSAYVNGSFKSSNRVQQHQRLGFFS